MLNLLSPTGSDVLGHFESRLGPASPFTAEYDICLYRFTEVENSCKVELYFSDSLCSGGVFATYVWHT